jgi:uncharacterized protein
MTGGRHLCPGLEAGPAAARLEAIVRAEPWLLHALDAVAASGLPDAWIGAGAIRDVVWGHLHSSFDPAEVKDVDVAYFDPGDLSRDRDQQAQHALAEIAGLPWEATNQAAVHTWYHDYFGGLPVDPLRSVHDAIATWPETATCVGVRRAEAGGGIEVCAPYGLRDLLDGVWRVNPVRVTAEVSQRRLARQRVPARWPGVTVIPPGSTARSHDETEESGRLWFAGDSAPHGGLRGGFEVGCRPPLLDQHDPGRLQVQAGEEPGNLVVAAVPARPQTRRCGQRRCMVPDLGLERRFAPAQPGAGNGLSRSWRGSE